MNTKMLMLGILLIAGLSFAVEFPNNWMTNVVNRYGCNFFYNAEGWEDIGLYSIADEYDEGEWDFEAMEDHLDDMEYYIYDDGEFDPSMCAYAGCWFDGEEMSATGFRSYMLAYNAAAAAYRAEFLAGMRSHLAGYPGDRDDMMEDIGDAMADYRACLVDAIEDGPCDKCD